MLLVSLEFRMFGFKSRYQSPVRLFEGIVADAPFQTLNEAPVSFNVLTLLSCIGRSLQVLMHDFYPHLTIRYVNLYYAESPIE